MQSAHQVVSHLPRHFCLSAFLADVDIFPLKLERARVSKTSSLFILKSSLHQPEEMSLVWLVGRARVLTGRNIRQADPCV